MYKTILVPVDLSHKERVGPMLEVAKLLADDNSKIVLANVIEDIPAYITAQIPKDILKASEEDAASGLKAIAAEAGVEVETEVRKGHPGNTILDLADDRNADVIVIASHKPGWEDYLIGSTAARVVRHAKCAVHVLR